jgi:hypothetical protein
MSQRCSWLILLLMMSFVAAPVCASSQRLPLELLQRLDIPTAELSHFKPKMIMLFEPDCRFCHIQRQQMEQLLTYCPAVEQWLIGINGTERALKQQWQAWQTRLPLYVAEPVWLRQIGGVDATPTTLFVSADHQLLATHRGMLNQAQLIKAYTALSKASCVLPN